MTALNLTASTSVRVDDWPRGSNGLGNTCPFAHVAIRRWELPPNPSNLGVNGVHDPLHWPMTGRTGAARLALETDQR